jgi:DNA-binding NtrC family response regulator
VPRVWEALHSLFAVDHDKRTALPPRVPVVAMVVDEQDRGVLNMVSGREPLDLHFARSCEEGGAIANQLKAPVILFDRDWPGAEWKTAVETLAAAPHRACVILISGVSDDYLWQELIRMGGYDVLPKQLRPDSVTRILKLALSYWTSVRKPAASARRT